MAGVKGLTIAERFWAKVDKSNQDGCWLWTAARKGKKGHGEFLMKIDGKHKPIGAHRIAWMLTNGKLPDVTLIRSCDNIICVNPSHYEENEYETMTVEEFFRSKARPVESGCIEWQGRRDPNGYGGMMYTWPDGKRRYSHVTKVAWHLAYGIVSELNMLHKCDNPPCCNVDHLFEGTQQDNVDDMVAKGRDAFSKPGWSAWTRGDKHPKSKLTNDQAEQIRVEHAAGAVQRHLAVKYGVSTQCIHRVVRRKGYKEAGGA